MFCDANFSSLVCRGKTTKLTKRRIPAFDLSHCGRAKQSDHTAEDRTKTEQSSAPYAEAYLARSAVLVWKFGVDKFSKKKKKTRC